MLGQSRLFPDGFEAGQILVVQRGRVLRRREFGKRLLILMLGTIFGVVWVLLRRLFDI